MPRPLNIACLQTRPMPDFASALEEATPLALSAVKAGADFIFLPEYCGGLASNGAALTPPSAPENQHPVLSAFQEFAATHSIWVMLGSIAVDGPDSKLINRGFIINDRGEIHSRYDKIHMFDIEISATESYRESTHVVAGGRAVLVDSPFGKIGHTICYDLRFPNLYRQLAQAGAEIICAPSAFLKKTGQAHWHILNRARAIENGVFLVSPCAVGEIPGGGESYGHSLVVSPWGDVISDAGPQPGLIHAEIDLDLVKETRARIPSLSHDRPYELIDSNQRNVA